MILLNFITMLILLICSSTFLLFADFINMLSSDSIRFYSIRVFFSQQIFMRCSMICICSNLQILLLIECLFIYIIA